MFEIKTPDLRRCRDVANAVIDGVMGETMERKAANVLLRAAKELRGGVATELQVRLAAPRIIAADAKLIEHAKTPDKIETRPDAALDRAS